MALEETTGEKRNAERTTIQALRLKPKRTFYYLFDYGDSWWHEITVESIDQAETRKYPAVVAARGDSPPQYEYSDEE